jgi:hypothetical protein
MKIGPMLGLPTVDLLKVGVPTAHALSNRSEMVLIPPRAKARPMASDPPSDVADVIEPEKPQRLQMPGDPSLPQPRAHRLQVNRRDLLVTQVSRNASDQLDKAKTHEFGRSSNNDSSALAQSFHDPTRL